MAKSWVSSCLIHDTWKKNLIETLRKSSHFLFFTTFKGKNFSFIVTKACKKGLNWAKILYFLHCSTRIFFFFGDQCPNTFYIFLAMTKFPRSWLLAGLIFQNNFYTTSLQFWHLLRERIQWRLTKNFYDCSTIGLL